MATLKDLEGWMARDFARFGKLENHVLRRVEHTGAGYVQGPNSGHSRQPETVGTFMFYTRTNRYRIRAVERDPSAGRRSYLGCGVSSRTPRAGENWTRGNDLPDGPLCEETWRQILAGIVAYEMVKVQGTADIEPDNPIVVLPEPVPAA